MIDSATASPRTRVDERVPFLSIVTPAYNEQDNLPILFDELWRVLAACEYSWEWVIVDDHSRDSTFGVIQRLSGLDARVRGVRLSRNSGSHIALNCGLHHARGDCAVVLAADLQDPPSVIVDLIDRWAAGAQVVWAVRNGREGEATSTIGSSLIYYWIMRRFVGIHEMPATGADFFLIDRTVIDALKQFRETNTSLLALLTWMGYRQDKVSYTKQARVHGASGWSVKKKLKLAVDSVTAFSYAPIRLISYTGFIFSLVGFLYALVVIVNATLGSPPSGWSSMMVVLLVAGGIQMIMMGVLGEYLWRALDEARGRPAFLIEARIDRAEEEADAEQPWLTASQ